MRALMLMSAAALVGCAASDRPTQQAALADVPGKAIGESVYCIQTRDVDRVEAVNDYVAFIHMRGNRTYRTDFANGCRGLGHDAFTHRSTINQYCSGDIIQLYDTAAGYSYGACVFGSFTPYELPKGAPKPG